MIALPIQFKVFDGANWEAITNASSKALLSKAFAQLLLNIREEVATSFCWLMIAFLVMRLLKIRALNKSNLKLVLVVLSILFAIGHFSNAVLIAKSPALNKPTRIFGTALVFVNAFIVGIYFKTVYIRTRSIQTYVMVHFLCGLRRAFFPMISQQIDSITSEQIGYEALILVVYIVAIVLLWQKQWRLEKLNEVYATMDADPTKIQA